MNAILGGSRVYGKPNKDSDLDLVLWLPNSMQRQIVRKEGDETGDDTVRYGNLNIILPNNAKEFSVWLYGIELLKQHKPVTRDKAVETFDNLRMTMGIEPLDGSG